MTQLMIDTSTSSRAELLRVAAFLTEMAALGSPPATPVSAADTALPATVIMPVEASEVLPDPAAVFAVAPAVPQVVTPEVPPPPAAIIPPMPPAPATAADVPSPPVAPNPAIPAAATPAATVTTTAAAAGVDERDVKGMKWDERIHAGTKAKNADGTWRNRRNLKPEVLAAVQAELAAGGAPVPAAPVAAVPPPPPAAATVIPPPPPPVVAVPPVVAIPVPPAPVATAGAVPPIPDQTGVVAPVLSGPVTFATLMAKITAAMNAQKLTKPQVDQALAANSVANLAALVNAGDKWAAIDQYITVNFGV